MREVIQHPVYGEIIYDESIWTGKKTLTVNGVNATKISKKEFALNEKRFTLKGSYISGVSLCVDDEAIELSPKTTWYEIALAIIPFLFLIIWGNSVALCAIFPVIGGAIGGALGGVAIVVSLFFMKKQKSPILKVLIGAAVIAATIFVAYIIALGILQLLA